MSHGRIKYKFVPWNLRLFRRKVVAEGNTRRASLVKNSGPTSVAGNLKAVNSGEWWCLGWAFGQGRLCNVYIARVVLTIFNSVPNMDAPVCKLATIQSTPGSRRNKLRHRLHWILRQALLHHGPLPIFLYLKKPSLSDNFLSLNFLTCTFYQKKKKQTPCSMDEIFERTLWVLIF